MKGPSQWENPCHFQIDSFPEVMVCAMKNELLAKLEAMGLDKPGIPLPFSTRLAGENGWRWEERLRRRSSERGISAR